MQFEFGLGHGGEPPRRRPADAPFCLLVCADLSGGAARPGRAPLSARKPVRVDADTLGRAIAQLRPTVEVRAGDGAATLVVDALDGFHPDHLVRSLPAFATLRQLREELGSPAGFARAAAALGFGPALASAAAAEPPTASAVADIERLLGRPPQAAPTTPPSPLEAWLRGAVAPHVVPDTGGSARMLTAAVDAALGEQMRAVLRDPAFRQLEATWRGVERLVSELGGEPEIELWLLDAARDELVRDVRDAAADLSASALWRQLGGPDAQGAPVRPWSVVVVDHAFGHGPEDVALLAAAGSMAARIGAALLADADPSVLGCARAADLREPARWASPDRPALERWQSLRRVDAAAWIGLALPRVLMRRPYGAKSDPVEAFGFEEVVEPDDTDGYLWGGCAMLLAMLAGRAFRDAGWAMDLDAHVGVADMPAYAYRVDGESRLRPCAETLLADAPAERILAAGIMAVSASPHSGELRLQRWQSLADPLQRLRGPWG